MQSAYEALGFRFRVDTADTGLAGHVDRLLAGCRSSVTEAGPLLPVDDSPGSLISLVGTVNMRAIGAAGGSLLLHAGAVCRGGRPRRGPVRPVRQRQEHLHRRAGRQGARLRHRRDRLPRPESLRIPPFRKPLSLKAGSHHVLPHLRPPADPHLVRGSGGQWLVHRPRWAVHPFPQDRCCPTSSSSPRTHPEPRCRWTASLIGRGGGLHAGRNTSRLRDVRDRGLPALARLVRRAPAYRVVYEDVHAAADAVQDLWDRVA